MSSVSFQGPSNDNLNELMVRALIMHTWIIRTYIVGSYADAREQRHTGAMCDVV